MGAKYKPNTGPLKAPVLKQSVKALGRVCPDCHKIIEVKKPPCLRCGEPINLKYNAVPHGWFHDRCEDSTKEEAVANV